MKHSIREMHIVNAAYKMCSHLNDNSDNVEQGNYIRRTPIKTLIFQFCSELVTCSSDEAPPMQRNGLLFSCRHNPRAQSSPHLLHPHSPPRILTAISKHDGRGKGKEIFGDYISKRTPERWYGTYSRHYRYVGPDLRHWWVSAMYG